MEQGREREARGRGARRRPRVRRLAAVAHPGPRRRAAPYPEGGRGRDVRDRTGPDLRPRGRVRLRQDHGRADGGGPPPADRGKRPHRRGLVHRPRRRGRPAAPPAPHPHGLPGPLREPQSALADRAHHRRADPRLRPRALGRGGRRTGRRAASPGGAPSRRPAPLPPRVLGRSAPTGRHRPRPRLERGSHRLRRTDLGPRRLRAGADPQPDARPPGPLRPHLPPHQPRPRSHPAHGRPHRGHVPGEGGRDRGRAGALPRSASPLYPDAARGGPGRRDTRASGRRDRGRDPEPHRPAPRLRLPSRAAPSPSTAAAAKCPCSWTASPATPPTTKPLPADPTASPSPPVEPARPTSRAFRQCRGFPRLASRDVGTAVLETRFTRYWRGILSSL